MDLQARLDALERRCHRLVRGVWTAALVLAVATVAGFAAEQEPGVIRATEVSIEDPNGVVRARLGGDLSDAVFDGRTIDRGSPAAGLMLYDTAGGGHAQTAFFVAENGGATALRISSGDDHVELRTGSDGGAWFNAVKDRRPGRPDPGAREPRRDRHVHRTA